MAHVFNKILTIFIFVVLFLVGIQANEDEGGKIVSFISKNDTGWQCKVDFYPKNIDLKREEILIDYTCQINTASISIKVGIRPKPQIQISSNCQNDYVYKPGFGYYKYHHKALNWTMARRACQEEGSYLAIINSRGEADLLVNMFNENSNKNAKEIRFMFVGFHDLFIENEYLTIHGESLQSTGYTDWSPGQPDNYKGVEDCGSIYLESGKLNDLSCTNEKPFVCEKNYYN